MPRPLALAATMLGLAFALAPAAAGQDYEIKIDRPFKVGQEFDLAVAGQTSNRHVITAGGQTLRDRTKGFAYEMETTAKVLEINEVGRPIRLSLTLTKCNRTEEQETKALIEKSMEVLAYVKEGQEVFETDGNPVPVALHEVLREAVWLSRRGPSNKEALGPEGRKKVGDRWDINAEVAARDIQRRGANVTEEQIQGTATLEKTVKESGVDCLVLHRVATIKGMPAPLPKGLTCESALTQVDIRTRLPIDTALGPIEECYQASLHIVASGKPEPPDPEVHFEAWFDRKNTIRYTYPPPAAKKE